MNAKTIRNIVIKVLEENMGHKWTFESIGDQIEEALAKKKDKKKILVKRSKSCYNIYCQRHRSDVIEEMSENLGEGNFMPNDVVRALAGKWKGLKEKCAAGDEEALMEMDECKDEAEKDKERYSVECESLCKKQTEFETKERI